MDYFVLFRIDVNDKIVIFSNGGTYHDGFSDGYVIKTMGKIDDEVRYLQKLKVIGDTKDILFGVGYVSLEKQYVIKADILSEINSNGVLTKIFKRCDGVDVLIKELSVNMSCYSSILNEIREEIINNLLC